MTFLHLYLHIDNISALYIADKQFDHSSSGGTSTHNRLQRPYTVLIVQMLTVPLSADIRYTSVGLSIS
jgi:hypothetical protein